ncbi:MAG: hypothetical protein LBU11_00610 [Zoogloeaceae bacterium]|nr:hypothetical protein [Zoogloeaceae bacterium]
MKTCFLPIYLGFEGKASFALKPCKPNEKPEGQLNLHALAFTLVIAREIFWGSGRNLVANVGDSTFMAENNTPRQFHPPRHCEARSAAAIQRARKGALRPLDCHGPSALAMTRQVADTAFRASR